MKILASTREYPTYEEYEASGKFDMDQLGNIRLAFRNNFSPKQISILANPEFSADQMAVLSYWMSMGIPLRRVVLMANPELSVDQMEVLSYYAHREDVSDEVLAEMAASNAPKIIMQAMAHAYLYGLEDTQFEHLVSLIERYNITDGHGLSSLIGCLTKNLTDEQLDLLFLEDFSPYQMDAIVLGIESGLTMEQVKFYADPKISGGKMEELMQGLLNGAPMSRLSKFLSDEYDEDDVREFCWNEGYYPYDEDVDEDDWEDDE